MQLLTYLAQVRQLHYRNAKLYHRLVSITLHFLPIKQSKKAGISRKEIATIGIVRDVDWDGQSKNMVVWSTVAGNWLKRMIYISSQSHAKGKK